MDASANIVEKYLGVFIDYVPTIIGAILTLIIGFWIVGRIVSVAKKAMTRAEMDVSLANFLGSLLSVGLKVMLILAVAAMFGVATTSFIAVFSAVAFAIGMALQGNLGHLASGVMLMIFKPFKVDDLVDLGGSVGTVEAINAFNTTLRTLDNRRIYLPNGHVTSNPIINISGQETVGVDMNVGIGYSDDIDKARSIIQSVANACPQVLSDPETLIQVNELADNSVNFIVRPWCKSEHYWDVWFYMNENIKKEFDKAGVGIPFPQMDVHLHKSKKKN